MEIRKETQLLYEKLLRVAEIPVLETEIWSPGFYQSQKGEHRIYIKKSLSVFDKIKVLAHEYVHYLHLNKYYENESRADCEIIAFSAAYLVSEQLDIGLFKSKDFEVLYAENLNKDINIVYVELSKLDEILKKSVSDMTDLEKWAVFFQYASIPTFRETVNNVIESKEVLQMA